MEYRESSEPNYPGIKLDTCEKIFNKVLEGRNPKKIAFSGITITTIPVYETVKKATGKGKIIKADNIMIDLRMRKSKSELTLLRKSADISNKSF